jgi:hypothetical protein
VLRVLEGAAPAASSTMIGATVNALAGLVAVGALCSAATFCTAVAIYRARFDRAAFDLSLRVASFLDELKTDAAYAAVCDYPYSGGDLLGMLGRHDLVTEDETSRLLRDATLRVPDDFTIEPEPDDEPHARNGRAGSAHSLPMDEEAPF